MDLNQTRSLLGVRHKLVAFETQLGKYPPWSGKYNEVAACGVIDVSHASTRDSVR